VGNPTGNSKHSSNKIGTRKPTFPVQKRPKIETTIGQAGLSRDDVVSIFSVLLGRPPKHEGGIAGLLSLNSRDAVVAAVCASDEFKKKYGERLYPFNLENNDKEFRDQRAAVFEQFRHYTGAGSPGYVINFLGVRTRTEFSKSLASFGGKVTPPPFNGDFYADGFEWMGFLKSVLGAGDRFRLLELGAGWGPWMASGVVAAQSRGIRDIRVYGVEADKRHVEFIARHQQDNGVAQDQYETIWGLVGQRSGIATFPVAADAASDYGQRVLTSAEVSFYGNRFSRFEEILMVGISEREPVELCSHRYSGPRGGGLHRRN
jgi:hypothetical protein